MTGFFCIKKWITKRTYPFTFTEFKIKDIFWAFALSDGLVSTGKPGCKDGMPQNPHQSHGGQYPEDRESDNSDTFRDDENKEAPSKKLDGAFDFNGFG
jgi:hypothetical protein